MPSGILLIERRHQKAKNQVQIGKLSLFIEEHIISSVLWHQKRNIEQEEMLKLKCLSSVNKKTILNLLIVPRFQ